MVRRTTVWAAVVLSLVGVLGACGDERPNLATWVVEWEAVVAEIPPLTAFGADDRPLCDRTLASLREAGDELIPAPTRTIGQAVTAWLEFGQSVFFECPIPEGDHAGFRAGFAELERLSEQVEAAIDTARGSG